MQKFNLIFTLLICSLVLCSSSVLAADKIPVTTASEKALEHFLKGRDLQERLQGQESITYFQKAVEEDPDFAMAWYYLALVSPSAREFLPIWKRLNPVLTKYPKAKRCGSPGLMPGSMVWP